MNKLTFMIITAILCTIPSLCGAMDFYPPQPGMAAKIQALKEEVRAKGGTYEVAYSAAMDKQIKHLAGLKIPHGWNKSDAPSVTMLESSVQALPSSFDWRSLNGVTPIKDQGNCGGCWAFGTVGPLESQILLKDTATVELSEQYLISCNLSGWSCNGGWWAHDYHLDWSGQDNNGPGAVLNAAKPYTGTDSACGGTYKHPYKLTSWAYVGSQSAVPSVQAIKQAIYTYGPIGAGVYVGPYFQAYSGGVFNTNESGQINHAIVLVGWNDDIGPDDGYWILRNSWGTSWGESGYMRIRYGISQVGYAANFIEYAGGTPNPSPSPASVNVPNVVGDTEANAATALTGAGLAVGTVSTQSSAAVPSGSVISQNPAAGASVALGSAVNLLVSSGSAPPSPPPSPDVSEPDLTGVFANLQAGFSGRVLTGAFEVENVGTAATTNSFRVLLYLSMDGVSKTALLGSATVSVPIQPGYYINLRIHYNARTSLTGTYLIAVIDPDSSVPDSNRSNNVVLSNIIQSGR